MSVVLRTDWGDIEWCLANLSVTHLQNQVIGVTSVDGINAVVDDVTGQLSRQCLRLEHHA